MSNNIEKQIYFGSKDELDSSKLKQRIKFSDIATEFDYGVSAEAKEFDGENQYIRITDITDNGNFDKSKLSSPSKGLENKFLVHENDILFARTGASVGKSYLYDPADGILYFAGFLIRMNVSNLNSYYVKSYLQTNQYWKQVKLMSARSGQPGINSMEYKNFTLPNVTIEKSEKIGELLSSIDNLINLKAMSISKLKTHTNYIRNNMMFNTDNKSIRLTDFATITGGYAFKSKDMIEQENDHRILRIGDIKPSISESNFTGKYYHSDNLKSIPIASTNQLVIALSGATFGKVGIVQDGIYLLNQRTAVITSISHQIIINQLLQTDHFKNYIQSIPSASAQPNISTSDLEIYSFSPSHNYYKISIFLSQMDNLTYLHCMTCKTTNITLFSQLYLLFLHILC